MPVLDVYAPAPAYPIGGDAGCPCINVTSHLAVHAPQLLNNGTDPCAAWSDGSGTCLGDTYGNGRCIKWDDSSIATPVSEGCATGAPAIWCYDEFCYVDRENCWSKPHAPATYRWGGQPVPYSARLDYSYHTCGFTDKYVVTREKLLNLTLRVTAPAVTNPTAGFWREDAQGNIDSYGEVWKGATWQMLQALSDEYGFTLQRQRLSAESIDRSGGNNNFTACCQAVAVNETDLCVADFWASSSRRGIMAPTGAFSVAFDTGEFYLVSHAKIQSQLWDAPFIDAFSPGAWAVVIGVMAWMTATYYLAEHIAARRRKARFKKRQELARAQPAEGEKASPARAAREASGASLGEGSSQSVNAAVMRDADDRLETLDDVVHGVLTAPMPTNHDPSSTGGRVVNCGCVFFAIIANAFWSSAVISQMVANTISQVGAVTSLVGVQQQNQQICANKFIYDQMKEGTALPNPAAPRWSRTAVKALVVDGTDNLGSLNGMDTGLCAHSVLERSQIQTAMAMDKTHCNKGAVGSSVMPPTKIALPVRLEIEPVLSYMIHNYTQQALYAEAFETAVSSRWQSCPVFLSQRSSESNTARVVSVQYAQLNVAMVATLALGLVGVLISRFEPGGRDDWLAQRRARRMFAGAKLGGKHRDRMSRRKLWRSFTRGGSIGEKEESKGKAAQVGADPRSERA